MQVKEYPCFIWDHCCNMDNLDVHPRIVSALKKAKLQDYGQILSMSAPDIERATQLSLSDVRCLHRAIAEDVLKVPLITALDLFKGRGPKELQVQTLTTGCDVVDKFLRGGVISRGITEIAGESASGKTQFCMQLCLTVQLPLSAGGLGGGALYVCTEDVFPNKRLMQMVDLFNRRISDHPDLRNIKFTDNIFIEHVADLEDLEFCIGRKAPLLLSQGRAKLVIIDSIAGLFRVEFSLKETAQRAKRLSSFASKLHQLSLQHNIPIVCVNQVSAVVNSDRNLGDRTVTPALGLSWANMVTSRLMLARTNQTVSIKLPCTDRPNKSVSIEACVRTMEAMFAPHLPNSICHYIIDQEGVKGLQ